VRFTKPKKVVGLDIGSHSIKAVQMAKNGDKLNVEEVGYAVLNRNLMNSDPTEAHALALREALSGISVSQSMVVGALPGQTVVIRYPRLRNVAEEDMSSAIEKEANHNIPYDLSEVLLDWSVLEKESDGENEQTKVLLVAAKHEVIDSRVQFADAAEIQYNALSVDSLALADAADSCHMFAANETVALINIGSSTVSIHFTKDGVSNFIRDISWGAKELIQSIAKARQLDFETAEQVLFDSASQFAQEDAEIVPVEAVADDDTEPVSDAPSNASLLEPLDSELGLEDNSLGAAGDDLGAATAVETPISEILAQPVERLVTEVRRSFDYYEHQLYEHPVERIILSGGVAHLPMIREALQENLDIENVVVADPSESAIHFKKSAAMANPSQFMVAVGLAAQGAVEL
jgi:type IV pilus assembly protein PilM